MLFTAGTTIRDANNRDWAYLLWQGTTPTLLRGRAFAIYFKAGDATAAVPYQRKAIVALQTDPLVIDPLLRRSLNLGGDLALLETSLLGLFQNLMPPGSSSVAQKLAAVILGSQGDDDHYENLILMSRLHPGVALSLGMAHAEIIGPGQTTFEVRDFDLAKSADIGVVGRVTVTAGAPTVLPAPGRPVQVLEYPRPTSAKGDLNVKLRWATPPELRRLALMNYGFNLYRMNRAFAEAPERRYDLDPPSPATLLQLLRDHPNDGLRVNRAPVLADKDFDPNPGDPAYVGNLDPLTGDPTTFFAHDDNRRFEPGHAPFRSGEQFYYFVTARDLLGRDGLISRGQLVTVCDRLPPPVPRHVKVENDYVYAAPSGSQRLQVSWDQNDNRGTEQTVRYYVYRWDSPKQMHTLAGNPAANRIASVNHIPGLTRRTNADTAISHPGAGVLGKTYWYTVRAVDQGVPGACEQNVSGNSGPMFGVLRDRTGLGASPGARVEVLCVCPTNWFTKVTNIAATGLSTNSYRWRAINERRSAEIDWAEFSILCPTGIVSLGRAAFPAGQNISSVDYSLPRTYVGPAPRFRSRVGSARGKVSNFATQSVNTAGFPATNLILGACFQSDLTALRVRPEECDDEAHRCPPGPACADEPRVCALPPAGAREYRVYRRVDDGPLTLIGQGEVVNAAEEICVPDRARPANAATLCNYVQFFDEHGNAGPLERVGECYVAEGSTPLPVPMLAAIELAGSALDPKMTLRWFCPPYGLERFKIFIAEDRHAPPHALAATPAVVANFLDPLDLELSIDDEEEHFFMGEYLTSRIGPGFGNGAEFILTVNVQRRRLYSVFVVAVAKGGAADLARRSNVEQFRWRRTVAPDPGGGPLRVPWPWRDHPPVEPGLIPPNDAGRDIAARFFQQPLQPYTGGGVRIGEVNFPGYNENSPAPPPYATPGLADPMSHLYPNAEGPNIFPVVLYRLQVPSVKFPSVSGDIVQVSPLMERIAYRQEPATPLGPVALIYDPFIAVISEPGGAPTAGQTNPLKGIYLLDTQPVIRGARYKYLLVRFHAGGEGAARGEIHAVVPTNEVEVP